METVKAKKIQEDDIKKTRSESLGWTERTSAKNSPQAENSIRIVIEILNHLYIFGKKEHRNNNKNSGMKK